MKIPPKMRFTFCESKDKGLTQIIFLGGSHFTEERQRGKE